MLLAVDRRLSTLPSVGVPFSVPIELTGLVDLEPSIPEVEGRVSVARSGCEETVESGRRGKIVLCSLTGLDIDLRVGVEADTGVSTVLALRG